MKRIDQAENTKRKILKAAIDLMGEQGKKGLTASALIERAEISKGALYHHFKSLDQVPFAAFEVFVEDFVAVSYQDYRTGKKYLLSLGENHFKTICERNKLTRAYIAFLESSLDNPEIKKYIEQMVFQLIDYMQEAIFYFYKCRLSKKQKEHLAFLIGVILDGMALYYLIMEDKSLFMESWKILVKMVDDYLTNLSVKEM